MFFKIITTDNAGSVEWQLLAGSAEKPGEVKARSAAWFNAESDARSDIAAFRKSASGVKFAKVVTA